MRFRYGGKTASSNLATDSASSSAGCLTDELARRLPMQGSARLETLQLSSLGSVSADTWGHLLRFTNRHCERQKNGKIQY